MASSSDGDASSHTVLSFSSKFLPSNIMSTAFKLKKGWLVAIGACLVLLLFYASMTGTKKMSVDPDILKPRQRFWFEGYTVWPEFQSAPIISNQYFQTHCAKNVDYSIAKLPAILEEWSLSKDKRCHSFHEKFKSVFSVELRKAPLAFPEKFFEKVKGWLGNIPELVKEVPSQTVIHMINKFTREHTIFNPLRDKRPVAKVKKETEMKYVNEMVANTSATCDFCKFREMTAEHVFGRVETQHAFTASNVFKLDTLHALVVPKQHHPLNWSKDEFMDMTALTVTWLEKAKMHYPEAKYPSLTWDVLPHCGASQVHPHIQLIFDPTHYEGVVESWRRGAQDYYNIYGSNFYSDLVNIYSALNLTVTYGQAVAFPNLVPRRDNEVVIMAKEPNADFFNLIYFTLRGFIDDLQFFCFSMGLAYPAVGGPEGKIAAYARIITRGSVTELRNDISALELFSATNVNVDPWKTKRIVEESMRKRAKALR